MGRWRRGGCFALVIALSSQHAVAQSTTPASDEEAPPPEAEPASAATEPAPAEQECFPACRTGYTCHQGACVSLCNPPCESGSSCSSAGECVASAPAPAPEPALAPPPVYPGQYPAEQAEPADPGWASGGAVIGFLTAVGAMGLGIASASTVWQGMSPAIELGSAATGVIAVGVPLSAIGGASARRKGDVDGLLGLRITGWIAYGLSVTNAAVLIGLGASEADVPAGAIIATTALGALAGLSMGIDAAASAAEARRESAASPPSSQFAMAPSLSPVFTPRAAERLGAGPSANSSALSGASFQLVGHF